MSFSNTIKEINKITEEYFFNVFKALDKNQWNSKKQVKSVSDNSFDFSLGLYKSQSDIPITKYPFCVFKVSQPVEDLGAFRLRGPFRENIEFEDDDKTKIKTVSVLPITNDLEFKVFYESFDSIENIYELLIMNFYKFSEVSFISKNFGKDKTFKFSIKSHGSLKIDEYPNKREREGKEGPGQLYSLSFSMKRYSVIYMIPIDFSKIIESVKIEMYQNDTVLETIEAVKQ